MPRTYRRTRGRKYTRSVVYIILLLLILLLLILVRTNVPIPKVTINLPTLPALPTIFPTEPQPGVPATGGLEAPTWGVRTRTEGCQAAGALPDRACTPGDVFPNVTKADICVSGYAKSVRNVPESEKNQVYADYGIASRTPGQYEVDHLVSLELGGSNDISNLWPEPAAPKPGFHEKDQVENYLHDQVCSGAITLAEAQSKIAVNWLDVYNKLLK